MSVSNSRVFVTLVISLIFIACSKPVSYDLILRGGTIVDGSGDASYVGDVAINGDAIAALGDLGDAVADNEIDVSGLAVAPGFVNMLSWSTESLIEDGLSQSEIRQGVTLEVFGEGQSMGPLNEQMANDVKERTGFLVMNPDIHFDVEWRTFGEYLEYLEARGVSPNIASYLGAATPREYVIGHEDRAPTPEELDEMRALVRQAMEEGAMGIASSLIYPPGSFADTEELIELAKVAAEYNGAYASHMRNEGSALLEAIDELITIAREANIRAEIYHYKVAGKPHWGKFDESVALIEAARAEGLAITADVYTYPAGATGLNAAIPPWVQEGGFEASARRMQDPAIRKKLAEEMLVESDDWDNAYVAAGTPDNILLAGFKSDALKPLTGKTLAEVAAMRGTSPQETAMDLIIEDGSRINTIYFTQSDDIVRKISMLPWVSFNSDEASQAPEGIFLQSNPHPRAYGSFSRVLAQYVREEQVITLEEAVRKLAALPAEVLQLDRRGILKAGNFADVVVFDPATIQDHATFIDPHQYATGMQHVFVNGTQVIKDGEHTGATPGRVVRGPGWVQR